MLNVLDEFSHECLAIRVARNLKAIDVIDVLSELFILRGIPGHIRSDNGPEFVAKAVQEWIVAVGAKTAYIERGSPWEASHKSVIELLARQPQPGKIKPLRSAHTINAIVQAAAAQNTKNPRTAYG